MSPSEFTIEKAEAPNVGRGSPRSALRMQMESLKVGEVLRWRPTSNKTVATAHRASFDIRKALGRRFTVQKVEGGADIYRTQ
jgi:hypothetical protein